MEVTLLHVLLSLPFLVLALDHFFFHKLLRNKNLPPSPLSLPIIGHLHYLKHPLHQTLHALAEKYGPVFFLRLGSQPTVIVSSLQVAEECFTKHDVVLANRVNTTDGKYFGYNYTTVGSSAYGEHWRNLRRVSAIEIFSTHRLNAQRGIRRDEISRLLQKLLTKGSSLPEFTRVEMKSKLTELMFNIMMRMMAGKRYFGDNVVDNEEAKEFKYIIKEVFKIGVNPSEFLPVLRWMDYKGINKGMIRLFEKTDAFLQALIDEHRRKKIDGSEIKNTTIDHLLSLQESEPGYYTDQIIKGFIMVSN
ncbi:hypothetical protein CDL15_Pgr001712 [Punica granatum]|uniref:Cytochrome P450 81E8-like n=1 Tax=Punica granatum TaxID=22663 RepID=A0A218XBH0_PUNGR|nr:hypothetical protein CDL15_Pgr001712 [Punica granatum]